MCVVRKASCGHIAWIAATAIALPALGAELPLPMPVKAALPAKAPAPQLYDWTGFYAGAHLGYAWGRSDWTEQQVGLSGSLNMFQRYDAFANTGSWLAGLHAGYEYMLPNRVVVGAVADLSAPSWRSLNSISIAIQRISTSISDNIITSIGLTRRSWPTASRRALRQCWVTAPLNSVPDMAEWAPGTNRVRPCTHKFPMSVPPIAT
jgi:hypothetical protein